MDLEVIADKIIVPERDILTSEDFFYKISILEQRKIIHDREYSMGVDSNKGFGAPRIGFGVAYVDFLDKIGYKIPEILRPLMMQLNQGTYIHCMECDKNGLWGASELKFFDLPDNFSLENTSTSESFSPFNITSGLCGSCFTNNPFYRGSLEDHEEYVDDLLVA